MLAAIKSAWRWVIVIGAALLSVFAGTLFYGRRRLKEGLSLGEISEERDRLHEAAARGDDAAVEEEWRRSRK